MEDVSQSSEVESIGGEIRCGLKHKDVPGKSWFTTTRNPSRRIVFETGGQHKEKENVYKFEQLACMLRADVDMLSVWILNKALGIEMISQRSLFGKKKSKPNSEPQETVTREAHLYTSTWKF